MSSFLLDHPILGERYFFPRKMPLAQPHWVHTKGVSLACFHGKPFLKAKTVMFFHGNGETVTDYQRLYSPAMREFGLNYFFMEYRGYGLSSGQPCLTSMLGDVEAAIDSLGLPEEELIFFGRSIGSIYALHAAWRYPRAAGLILESGIADVLERVLLRAMPHEIGCSLDEMQEEITRFFNHKEKIQSFKGPKLLMHTRKDDLVALHHSELLFEWANEPKQLHIFERGSHNSIFLYNRKSYLKLLGEFLGKKLNS